MKATLKAAAITAGADKTIYDRKAMQNVLIDGYTPEQVICLIDEFNSKEKSFKTNGIDTVVKVRVAFVKQVNFQETSELNDADMIALELCCDKFMFALYDSGKFAKIPDYEITKHEENETDFNAIGWRMDIKLSLDGYAQC
jgi:hypothetical protein